MNIHAKFIFVGNYFTCNGCNQLKSVKNLMYLLFPIIPVWRVSFFEKIFWYWQKSNESHKKPFYKSENVLNVIVDLG